MCVHSEMEGRSWDWDLDDSSWRMWERMKFFRPDAIATTRGGGFRGAKGVVEGGRGGISREVRGFRDGGMFYILANFK